MHGQTNIKFKVTTTAIYLPVPSEIFADPSGFLKHTPGTTDLMYF